MEIANAKNHIIVGELLESNSSQQANMNTPKSMIVTEASWNVDPESQVTGGYNIGLSLTILQVLAVSNEHIVVIDVGGYMMIEFQTNERTKHDASSGRSLVKKNHDIGLVM
ncbi:hypothetical protein ACFE04_006122 [Oxalis oulophora]